MATLKEYFYKDFADVLNARQTGTLQDNLEKQGIELNIGQDKHSKTTFISIYIPDRTCIFDIIIYIIKNIDEEVLRFFNDFQVDSGFISDIKLGKRKKIFSRKIYLYLENDLTEAQIKELNSLAETLELNLTLRNASYLKKKVELEKPLAFISHDSRDKETAAKPIAIGLQKQLCSVWYDEYSLKVGDPLRESIEKGIKEAKKCILVISKNFINNKGWTKREFNAVFHKELMEKSSVMLPVWVDVAKEEIYEYSPDLLNRVALIWTDNQKDQEAVIQELFRAIKQIN